jgi:hypothetical protein
MISPDGNSVAAAVLDQQTGLSDIWIYDLKLGTASRFTFNSRFNGYPVWSPDSSHLAVYIESWWPDQHLSKGGGRRRGRSARTKSRAASLRGLVAGWPVYHRVVLAKHLETWVLPLFGDRKAFPYLQGDFNEIAGKLSPNGRWLANVADESKRYEVYIHSFPTPVGKWQVSTNGGTNPIWSRDGKELFFIAADGKVMAVEVTESGGRFSPGAPKALFDAGLPPVATFAEYDVAKDGRFLLPRPVDQGGSTLLEVIANWPATLKK